MRHWTTKKKKNQKNDKNGARACWHFLKWWHPTMMTMIFTLYKFWVLSLWVKINQREEIRWTFMIVLSSLLKVAFLSLLMVTQSFNQLAKRHHYKEHCTNIKFTIHIHPLGCTLHNVRCNTPRYIPYIIVLKSDIITSQIYFCPPSLPFLSQGIGKRNDRIWVFWEKWKRRSTKGCQTY